MSDNTWTTDIPTTPGWYWNTSEFRGKWQEPQMIELVIHDGEMCEVICTADGGEYESIKDFWCDRWMFQGPIAAPDLP